MSIVTDLYSSLEGERERERERDTQKERGRKKEREKTSKTRGDYASTLRERRYVSEPIEIKYSYFDC